MSHSKNNEEKNAKFYISKEDWKKVIAYAESAYRQLKSEIGGQLVVVEDEDGDFILKDPVILKQEVSGGNCEMEEEALAIHYSKMVGKYGDKIRHCWWHSHHTMGAFWSGTDNATILENDTHDFSVSLVVNLKQEYKLRVQFFYPFEHEENVVLNFLEDESDIDEVLDKEVNELCTKEQVMIGRTINKSPGQTGLWTQEDQNEVDLYNYGFHYGHLSPAEKEVDCSLIPENEVKSVHDLIEACQNKVINGDVKYEEFLNMRKNINDSIKKYNIQMKLLSHRELESVAYHYFPEDFLENINQEGLNANKRA